MLRTWRLSPNGSSSQLLDPIRLGEPLEQSVPVTPRCFAIVDHVILAAGFCDHSIRCFSADTGALLQSVYGHSDVVLCISTSPCGRYLAAGSRDSTVSVWSISGRGVAGGWRGSSSGIIPGTTSTGIFSSNTFSESVGAPAGYLLAPQPQAVLVGHIHDVVCVSVNGACDTVVSVSYDSVLLHTLSGDFVRSIRHTYKRPFLASIGSAGNVVVYYSDKNAMALAHFTINGRLLCEMALGEMLMDMLLTRDGEHVVTGGTSRTAVCRRLRDLDIVASFSCSATIRCIAEGEHATLFLGLASGEVIRRQLLFHLG